MDELLTLVLFYLGVTQSFVSLVLNMKFSDTLRVLDYPLEVDIVDDCTVSSSRVHRHMF